MAGEILPDSDVSILYNLLNYLGELEAVMDTVNDDLSTKSKSPKVHFSGSKKQRNKPQIARKQSKRQKRDVTKFTAENLSRKPVGFRDDTLTDIPFYKPCNTCYSEIAGYVPCEGNNYYTYASQRYKNPRHRKGKEVFKENECNGIAIDEVNESSEINLMRVIQEEMNELKVKLTTVVETLSNVVDALVKTNGDEDLPNKVNDVDFSAREKAVRELSNDKAVQFNEHKVKSRNRGRSGFCCLGSRSVKSTESDSDYYRPQQRRDSQSKLQKKDDRNFLGSSISEYQVERENSSSKSRESRTCEHVTVCHFLQQFLNRAKLLFF